MNKESKIYIAGHNGMVGSAIWRSLTSKGYNNLIGKTSLELDLCNQKAVVNFFEQEKPDFVFLAAAKVGGILANNNYKAEFLYKNLQIQKNIIHQSHVYKVKKLLFLGSSCIYPKDCPQPMKEEYLLTGKLESTNEPYSISKIAGIKMCESYYAQYASNFISVMPTNLYGPQDNYNLETSHVLPALIRKIYLGKALEDNNWNIIRKNLNKDPIINIDGTASKDQIISMLKKQGITDGASESGKSVVISIWGTGLPKREFLYVDDLASACVFLMDTLDAEDLFNENISQINIGSREEVSIFDLAKLIKNKIGFNGIFNFDSSKPDGTLQKLLDSNRLRNKGWEATTRLSDGLSSTYNWFEGKYS